MHSQLLLSLSRQLAVAVKQPFCSRYCVRFRWKTSVRTMSGRPLFVSSSSPVDSFLNGLAVSNSNIQLLQKERVILRAQTDGGKVALLSGGGSGHEPAHGGFVGKGMLSGAVAGDIFASPPVDNILAALRNLNNPKGTVVIVKNYTGDRLNFGLAIEQFRAESETPVQMVLVEDDVATRQVPTRARGIAGTLLYHKILGASAESGANMGLVLEHASLLKENLATLSVSVGHCQVPGNPPIDFPPDQYKIGLGIHNEPGVQRKNLESLETIIENVISSLIEALRPAASDEFFVLLNNLGGLSVLEMGNISNFILECASKRGLQIWALSSATMMTSINMPGFSVTLLKLTRGFKGLLLAPTECTAWTPVHPINKSPYASPSRETLSEKSRTRSESQVSQNVAESIRKAVISATRAVIESEGRLNELDAVTGDGDCGTSLAKLANKIASAENELSYNNPVELFHQLSRHAQLVGGTSGALYGILFGSFSNALKDQEFNVTSVAQAFNTAVEKMMLYSRAQPGQKSMLDVLDPVRKALSELAQQGASQNMQQLIQTANDAAEETKNMVAKVGRASYSSHRGDIQKTPDAGAVAVSIWLEKIIEAV